MHSYEAQSASLCSMAVKHAKKLLRSLIGLVLFFYFCGYLAEKCGGGTSLVADDPKARQLAPRYMAPESFIYSDLAKFSTHVVLLFKEIISFEVCFLH